MNSLMRMKLKEQNTFYILTHTYTHTHKQVLVKI